MGRQRWGERRGRDIGARSLLGGMLMVLSVSGGCSFAREMENAQASLGATPAVRLRQALDLDSLVPELADKRVVYVGERHDRYDHHLIQLEIIRALHARDPRLAIGMEAFQQPFQQALDDYVAGRSSEQDLLRDSEYFSRWGLDYRLYAPILRYAREHGLPVIALNLPKELTRAVGQAGIEGISEEERAQLPVEIDRSDQAYRQRLEAIFQQHPNSGQPFEYFLEVQLLWDEGMAERAVRFLQEHPDHRLVILAGGGHLAHGSGIPNRLERRLAVDSAIVLNGWDGTLDADVADFLLLPEEQRLPKVGRIGALLDQDDQGLKVSACLSEGPCAAAGLKKRDRILTLDGAPIQDMADLRLVMWDKRPGDEIILEIERKRWLRKPETLRFDLVLD